MQMIPALENTEFCIVQYFRVVGHVYVTVDALDRILSWIKLLLDRPAGSTGELSAGVEFGPVPLYHVTVSKVAVM